MSSAHEAKISEFYHRVFEHVNAHPNCIVVTEKLYDKEVQAWTKENCEVDPVCLPGGGAARLYIFYSPDDAMAFKLAWVED